jgi:hypothetical protein
MLRLASLNNPQITAFLDDFKSSYSEDGMRAAGRKLTRFYVAYFAGALVFFVVIAFVVTHF